MPCGTASVIIVDGVALEYLAASRKIMDPDADTEFEQHARGIDDQQARITITPTWVRYWGFGAGRLPRLPQDYLERDQT